VRWIQPQRAPPGNLRQACEPRPLFALLAVTKSVQYPSFSSTYTAATNAKQTKDINQAELAKYDTAIISTPADMGMAELCLLP